MRLYYIDWLRVITVLVVFFFHGARVFDGLYYWHIKSAEPSILLTLVVIFAGQWIMPLLFFLSGASTNFNLNRRRVLGYITERIKRLAVPLAFGTMLIAPPQAYLERVFRGMFEGPYWLYLLQHFGNYQDYKVVTLNFWFWWFGLSHHLWFLGFLLFYSVAALPLFLYCQSGAGQKVIGAIGRLFRTRGAIFLVALPLTAIQFFLRYHYPAYIDWCNFFYWMAFFVFGFILFADERFDSVVERNGTIALLLAAATFVPVTATIVGIFDWRYLFGANLGYLTEQAVCSLNTWSMIISLLYLGRRLLNFTHAWLRYANEAALPFYILHQTVIVIAAFYAVRLSAGNIVQFSIISAASLAASMALYELFIRRFNPVRFLFGMRPRPGQHQPCAQDGISNRKA